MSASPTIQAQSTKRPLEDPSSPSAPTDQPDAKRPALDKVLKTDEEEKDTAVADVPAAETTEVVQATNGVKSENSKGSKSNGHNGKSNMHHDETGWIHIRAVISSAEAATVIGKGGENVSTIRKLSGAKCTVSDYQKGAVERVLTVSGVVDAVAKVSPLYIVKVLTDCGKGFRSDHQNSEQRGT